MSEIDQLVECLICCEEVPKWRMFHAGCCKTTYCCRECAKKIDWANKGCAVCTEKFKLSSDKSLLNLLSYGESEIVSALRGGAFKLILSNHARRVVPKDINYFLESYFIKHYGSPSHCHCDRIRFFCEALQDYYEDYFYYDNTKEAMEYIARKLGFKLKFKTIIIRRENVKFWKSENGWATAFCHPKLPCTYGFKDEPIMVQTDEIITELTVLELPPEVELFDKIPVGKIPVGKLPVGKLNPV